MANFKFLNIFITLTSVVFLIIGFLKNAELGGILAAIATMVFYSLYRAGRFISTIIKKVIAKADNCADLSVLIRTLSEEWQNIRKLKVEKKAVKSQSVKSEFKTSESSRNDEKSPRGEITRRMHKKHKKKTHLFRIPGRDSVRKTEGQRKKDR